MLKHKHLNRWCLHMSSQQKEFSLHEKYEKESGVVLISGIQALVRALHTRSQLDQRAGLNSGGFVSGYRGSPLGGLDKELWSQTEELELKNIHFLLTQWLTSVSLPIL